MELVPIETKPANDASASAVVTTPKKPERNWRVILTAGSGLLFGSAALISAILSNTTTGQGRDAEHEKSVQAKELTKQLEIYAQMQNNATPIYLGSPIGNTNDNIRNVASVQPTHRQQQGCVNYPSIGWDRLYAERLFFDDVRSNACMDLHLQPGKKYIPVALHRPPQMVRGEFKVYASSERTYSSESFSCTTTNYNDCLVFIREQVSYSKNLFFEGDVFIQPAPLTNEGRM